MVHPNPLLLGGGGGGLLVRGAGPDRESEDDYRAAEGYGAGGGRGDHYGAAGVVIIYVE